VHGRLRAWWRPKACLNDSTACSGPSVWAIALANRRRDHTAGPPSVPWRSRSLAAWPAAARWQQRSWPWPAYERIPWWEDHLSPPIAAYGFLLAGGILTVRVLPPSPPEIMMGNLGHWAPSRRRDARPWCRFWDYAAFVVNSLIFLLMGCWRRTRTFTEGCCCDRHRHCSGQLAGRALPLSLLQACSLVQR